MGNIRAHTLNVLCSITTCNSIRMRAARQEHVKMFNNTVVVVKVNWFQDTRERERETERQLPQCMWYVNMCGMPQEHSMYMYVKYVIFTHTRNHITITGRNGETIQSNDRARTPIIIFFCVYTLRSDLLVVLLLPHTYNTHRIHNSVYFVCVAYYASFVSLIKTMTHSHTNTNNNSEMYSITFPTLHFARVVNMTFLRILCVCTPAKIAFLHWPSWEWINQFGCLYNGLLLFIACLRRHSIFS